MKKCVIVLFCVFALTSMVFANDVPTHLPYLQGYPDGSIKPQEIVTREMLAEVILRLGKGEPRADAFFDVPPTRWSYRAVCLVTELGIMRPERGYFRPTDAASADDLKAAILYFGGSETDLDKDEPMTRAQLARIINRLLHRMPQGADDLMLGMPIFSDNQDETAWYYFELQEASCAHTYEQTPQGERWTGLG